MSKKYNKVTFLDEGIYEGTISDVSVSETSDGKTAFVNVYITTVMDGEEIVLHKPFIENVGRNFALGKFVKDAGVMGKRGQVCYDDLIGLDVEFELTFNEKTYKPVLSNFEFFEFSEEDESEEEE